MRAQLCSANPHKLAELRAALPGWELELLGHGSYPPEEGVTYEENARAKAWHGRSLGPRDEWMLGEDSGIECAALDGAPGVESARWAPAEIQAESLLVRLMGAPDRTARMVTVLVALGPEGEEIVAHGILDGSIAAELRGGAGFGYDPVFIPDGQDLTVAELGDGWKRANSHRARAAGALLAGLS